MLFVLKCAAVALLGDRSFTLKCEISESSILRHFLLATVKKDTVVVYHLPKNSGNFGWDVNGKTVLVCPNGNFPK